MTSKGLLCCFHLMHPRTSRDRSLRSMAALLQCSPGRSMATQKAGFHIHVPFVEHLGVRITHRESGMVRLRLDPRAELENSWGSMHGGALMTLLDVALASAGRSLDAECNGALTVEIKV